MKALVSHRREPCTVVRTQTVAFALLASLSASPALAQRIHFGVKAGVPVTAYFETGTAGARNYRAEYSAATRRYTVGVSAEWRVTNDFGFEIDALYHRMGYVGIVNTISDSQGTSNTSAIDVKGNSWDFPLMTKYRFGRVLRPYFAAGGVLRYVGPVRGRGENIVQNLITGTTSRTALDTTEPSELRKRFYPGLTMTGGLECRAGRFRVLPEFRYTRWTANISGPGGLLRFDPNQAEFLLGMLF
jgi:hypothetical protein